MPRFLPLLFALACNGSSDGTLPSTGSPTTTTPSTTTTTTTTTPTTTPQVASPGCGLAAQHAAGGTVVWIDAGPDGDGQRSFWLTIPSDYDPDQPHKLIVGYAGTSWLGEWMVPYLDLENAPGNWIYVYPDPLWRDFDGWGNLGGWLLGPNAAPAHGDQDLVFTEAMLDWVEDNYCIDTNRVFATGHSWGGDMAMVSSCFLGHRFTASVPVAANEPYWFDAGGSWESCTGSTSVWTMFGIADDHFTWQDYPGEFGDSCVDFWLQERGCDGPDAHQDLQWGQPGECVSYTGCSAGTAYCLYGAQFGHQVPDYYSDATIEFFDQF